MFPAPSIRRREGSLYGEMSCEHVTEAAQLRLRVCSSGSKSELSSFPAPTMVRPVVVSMDSHRGSTRWAGMPCVGASRKVPYSDSDSELFHVKQLPVCTLVSPWG